MTINNDFIGWLNSNGNMKIEISLIESFTVVSGLMVHWEEFSLTHVWYKSKESKLPIGLSVWQRNFLVAQRIYWLNLFLVRTSSISQSPQLKEIYVIQSFELLNLPKS